MLNVTFVIFLNDKLQMVLFFSQLSVKPDDVGQNSSLLTHWQLLSLWCLDGLTSRSCYRRWSSSCLTLRLCVCFRWSTPRLEALPKGCTLTIWSWVWCFWPEDVMRRRQSVSICLGHEMLISFPSLLSRFKKQKTKNRIKVVLKFVFYEI